MPFYFLKETGVQWMRTWDFYLSTCSFGAEYWTQDLEHAVYTAPELCFLFLVFA